MTFDQLSRPLNESLSGRFFLVNYLPTVAGTVIVLVLVWSGAPTTHPDIGAAWRTAARLGVGEAVVLALGITLLAVVVQPLHLAMVRILEGDWPRWTGAPVSRWFQLRRRRRLARAASLPGETSDAEIQRAGRAASRLRQYFPAADHLVRPTTLGNVLTATQDAAGRAYGLDAAVVWPRLHPLLGDQLRAVVNDRRDVMDLATRLSVTTGATAAISAALLFPSGVWLLLSLVPLLLARLAYRGAVNAAVAYGEATAAAFDLHRFDLYKSLHLPLPVDAEAEMRTGKQLSAFWRQGRPAGFEYTHETAP